MPPLEMVKDAATDIFDFDFSLSRFRGVVSQIALDLSE